MPLAQLDDNWKRVHRTQDLRNFLLGEIGCLFAPLALAGWLAWNLASSRGLVGTAFRITLAALVLASIVRSAHLQQRFVNTEVSKHGIRTRSWFGSRELAWSEVERIDANHGGVRYSGRGIEISVSTHWSLFGLDLLPAVKELVPPAAWPWQPKRTDRA